MISPNQIIALAKKFQTNDSAILREYLQLWFLSQLYTLPDSRQIFFKGGTAIHLIFNAPRFSEDLDFTVTLSESDFASKIATNFISRLPHLEPISVKPKKTMTGETFLLEAKHPTNKYSVFVNLDFSFREKVFDPQKYILKPNYPVLFTSHIHHLSAVEIVAEKIRALQTRNKGRDLYDLWYLISLGTKLDRFLISQKLQYYNLKFDPLSLRSTISSFSKEEFVQDLKPFVGVLERDRLPDLFNYIQDFLSQTLPKQ